MTDDGIGIEGVKTVSEALKVNTTLKNLSLHSKKGKGCLEMNEKIMVNIIQPMILEMKEQNS